MAGTGQRFTHCNGRAAREQEIARPRGSDGHRTVTRLWASLLRRDEVATAVCLPALLVALCAERLFLAVADGVQAVRGDTELHQVILDGSSAAIAEDEVVFGGAAFVAVAFDGRLHLRVSPQKVGGLAESFAGVSADVCFVEVKVSVADFLHEKLYICGTSWLGRWRRRRSCYGDANAGISRAAGTTRGNRVGRGIGRALFGGALGRDGADIGRDGELCGVRGSPAQG